MTAKITITKTELLEMLSKQLGLIVEDVTICKEIEPSSRLGSLLAIGKNVPAHEKIAAIKALRAYASENGLVKDNGGTMSLCDAKWAIENWDKFSGFVIKHRRLPLTGYYSWDGYNNAPTLK